MRGTVHVHAACRGAGTDANVFMEMYGTKGSVGQTRLDNAANNFEKGKLAKDSNLTCSTCSFSTSIVQLKHLTTTR